LANQRLSSGNKQRLPFGNGLQRQAVSFFFFFLLLFLLLLLNALACFLNLETPM